MKNNNEIIDIKTIKFLIVGITNTLIGTVIMFASYNLLGLSYWTSSTANYIVGSVVSYLLNKYWTFHNMNRSYKIIIKFVINILICYFAAYGIAKPLTMVALSGTSKKIQENAAMLAGMIIFTILNYFGQRFFAFKDDKNNKEY